MLNRWASGLAPALSLEFLSGGALDGRIAFSRPSTATHFGASGLLVSAASGAPRIDYDPVTLACRGLLIEEQRTNILPYSLDGVSTGYTGNGGSLSAGGTYFGKQFTRFTADGTSAAHTLQGPTVSVTASTGYVLAVTVRDVSAGRVQLYLGGGAAPSTVYANFNFSTGLITATGAGVSASGVIDRGNGVYRIWIAVTSNASPTNAAGIFVGVITTDTAGRSQSNTSAGTFEAYGAQLEAGAFLTSFIPTSGAQATRAADVATLSLGPWFNALEGTIVAESQTYATGANRFVAALSDGTLNNEIALYASTSGGAAHQVTTGGAVQGNLFVGGVATAGAVWRDAFAFKPNDLSAAFNGSLLTPVNTATIPSVNSLRLGSRADATFFLNGYIRRIRYYRTRLPNTQLPGLTA